MMLPHVKPFREEHRVIFSRQFEESTGVLPLLQEIATINVHANNILEQACFIDGRFQFTMQ